MAISQRKIFQLLHLTRSILAERDGELAPLRAALAKRPARGEADPETEFRFMEQIVQLLVDTLERPPGYQLGRLMLELEREEIHYAMTHRRNERERLRKKRKRGKDSHEAEPEAEAVSFEPLSAEEIAEILEREAGTEEDSES